MSDIIISGAKQSGKSVELVKQSSINQIPIGVIDINHIQIYKSIANNLGISIPEPVFLNSNSFVGRKNKDIYVDDILSFFKNKYLCNLKGFTISDTFRYQVVDRNTKE